MLTSIDVKFIFESENRGNKQKYVLLADEVYTILRGPARGS